MGALVEQIAHCPSDKLMRTFGAALEHILQQVSLYFYNALS